MPEGQGSDTTTRSPTERGEMALAASRVSTGKTCRLRAPSCRLHAWKLHIDLMTPSRSMDSPINAHKLTLSLSHLHNTMPHIVSKEMSTYSSIYHWRQLSLTRLHAVSTPSPPHRKGPTLAPITLPLFLKHRKAILQRERRAVLPLASLTRV
mmetsp:Transcript_39583/g.77929  ORF Transcript_39583/g.77929 Transcript_39583/m.77929 type:complete len:152 (+) Transcript_39583:1149-1604(+)